ncbi:type II toxin-antitoxin system RelE/ParE family toxin [Rhodoplanes azumiensis]|uniref:Type II toxin-antitoxin system RelE/ParE family toxin n=1 Tax=Rhodoplanes azumiensis TaxID=1897628 RepID=A0ABW5AFD2_9BRAD
MKITYTKRALRHIEAIYEYAAQDDPVAAGRLVERFAYSVTRLRILPFSGRPSGDGRSRLLSVPGLSYVVVHVVRGDTVRILAVFHTSRNRSRPHKRIDH